MSGYKPLEHGSGWAIVVLTVVGLLITVLVKVVSMKFPDAAETGARERHRETVLLAGWAAQQRGEDLDYLVWEAYRRYAKEVEEEERKLGHTSKSIFGAGSGGPSAMNKDDEEKEPRREAVCASLQQSPASHRGRSVRRRSRIPTRAETTLRTGGSTPSVTVDRWSRERAGQIGEVPVPLFHLPLR
ncbi:hypothetical protein GJ744_009006 [Endocarpon pusillum]|uniref:Uncharacterized protein n=1 Tax=Endocarpon pusillum TaxID=364733 RepID=A0A8H7AJW4_9EURO|nr:hypothetical protein GJ744_009006 [Endocarpon pusillum]